MSGNFRKAGIWCVREYDAQDFLQQEITSKTQQSAEDEDGNAATVTVNSGYISSSTVITATIFRRCVGLLSFAPDIGSETSAWPGGLTGPETDFFAATISFNGRSPKWRCVRHHVEVLDTIDGEAVETQTWQFKSTPTIIEKSVF